MYAFIKGSLINITENSAVIDCSGVGYEILCTQSDIAKMSAMTGENILLHTQLVHREDSMTLFGFLDKKTKEGFLALQKVNGIGAKLALKILSFYEPDELFASVENEDIKSLENIPGIGAKMAKKIIFDLKGVLPSFEKADAKNSDTAAEKDLLSALINLGYRENDVRAKLIDMRPLAGSFEENFKKLLKSLAGR
jgi:Holliday junction DNA helicase RuvA